MKTKRNRLLDAWKTPALAALCVVNAALGLALVGDVLPATSPARAAAMQARPGDYLMIPATLTTANQDIIYIINTETGDLTAAAYERQGGITFIPPLRLSQVVNGN